ncbi:MAG TPA: hypothetical protein VH186_19655 [Chloroflexia bacterium]|nr:hypothetical protein [Chloroflexia bacterium]
MRHFRQFHSPKASFSSTRTWKGFLGVPGWLRVLFLSLSLLAGGLSLLFLSYQTHTYTFRLDVGSPGDAAYLTGFYEPQQNGSHSYRWTGPLSYVNLNYPSTPFELTFHAWAGRPDNRPVELEVNINGRDLRSFALDQEPHEYVLRSRLFITGPQGLNIAFRPRATFTDTSGSQPRELGIVLDWIEVRQAPSRFGLTIPPLFIMFWWLLIGAVPLVLAPILRLRLKAGMLLSGGSFLFLALLYVAPASTPQLRTDWPQVGGLLWLFQLLALLALLVLERSRWRKRFPGIVPLLSPSRRAWRLKAPRALLLSGILCFFYIATARGRVSTFPELQMMATNANYITQQLALPIDELLPDPPPGQVNPRFAPQGNAFALESSPVYWLGQKLARANPYLPWQAVGPEGFLSYFLSLANLINVIGCCLALYWLTRLLGYNSRIAMFNGLLYGTATEAWPYARTFLPTPLTALALLLSVGGWLKYDRQAGENHGKRWAAFSGFWLGLAIINDSPNFWLAPVFALFFYFSWYRRTQAHIQSKLAGQVAPTIPALASPAESAGLLPAPLKESQPAQPISTTAIVPVRSFRPDAALLQPEITFRPGITIDKPRPLSEIRNSWQARFRVSDFKQRQALLRLALAWALPLAAWLLLLGFYNLLRYGGLLASAPVSGTPEGIWEELHRLLFEPWHGFFLANPVLLMAFAGLAWFWPGQEALLKLAASLSVVYLLAQVLRPAMGSLNEAIPGTSDLFPLVGLWVLPLAPLVKLVLAGPVTQKSRATLYLYSIFLTLLSVSVAIQVLALLRADPPAFAPAYYRETALSGLVENIQVSAALFLAGAVLFGFLVRLRRHQAAFKA